MIFIFSSTHRGSFIDDLLPHPRDADILSAITNMGTTRSGPASCFLTVCVGSVILLSPCGLCGEEHNQGPMGIIYKGVYPFLIALSSAWRSFSSSPN
jgi:hypothetical protein